MGAGVNNAPHFHNIFGCVAVLKATSFSQHLRYLRKASSEQRTAADEVRSRKIAVKQQLLIFATFDEALRKVSDEQQPLLVATGRRLSNNSSSFLQHLRQGATNSSPSFWFLGQRWFYMLFDVVVVVR